jgi:hypothetical protein
MKLSRGHFSHCLILEECINQIETQQSNVFLFCGVSKFLNVKMVQQLKIPFLLLTKN